jgi:hypothetical protein
MTPAAESQPTAGPPAADGRLVGYPFRGPGLLVRVGPFAAIAVLAETSLVLPPGPASTWAAVASVVLLVAVAMRTADQGIRRRIDKTSDDLDHGVLILRDTVYGLEHRLAGRGLHAEILRLCEELGLAPELSFSGPVDEALHPGDRASLLELLHEALPLIGQQFVPARIELAASRDSYTAMIEATPVAGATRTTAASEFLNLRRKAAQAGIGIDIEPGPGSARVTWHVPVRASR